MSNFENIAVFWNYFSKYSESLLVKFMREGNNFPSTALLTFSWIFYDEKMKEEMSHFNVTECMSKMKNIYETKYTSMQ